MTEQEVVDFITAAHPNCCPGYPVRRQVSQMTPAQREATLKMTPEEHRQARGCIPGLSVYDLGR